MRDIWLCEFYKYFLTPSARFHQHQNCLQHTSRVKKILSDIDPSGGDVSVLAEEEGSRVWFNWVMPHLKSKATGTLKSYWTSLQKFEEFLTT